MEGTIVAHYDEADCELMRTISASPILLTVLFLQAICSLISLPFLVVAICDVSKMALIHSNTKLILIFYIAGLMVHSVARCFLMRIPFNASTFFVCSSSFMLALERLISTHKMKTYESNRFVGYIMIGIQVIITGILIGVMYSNVNLSGNQKLYYCHTTSTSDTIRTIAPVSILIILQVSAVIMLKRIEKVNTARSVEQRMNPDLTVRYSVGESLRTITIVTPFCYACCVFSSIFLVILCLIMFFNYLFEKAVYFALVDGSMLLPVYSLVLPILIRRMNRQVDQKNNSIFQRHITHSSGNDVTSHYFDALPWAWKVEQKKQ